MTDNTQKTRQSRPNRRCACCYFSHRIAQTLFCVKNAPAVDLTTGLATWPAVENDRICGQFRFTDHSHIDRDRWPRRDLPIYRDRHGDYCKIPLTQGLFAKVDPENYVWLSQFRWHPKINKTTTYAVRTITQAGKTSKIYMHRMIADTPDHLVCDHVNRYGLDNRIANLRNCTIAQNNANKRAYKNASSKYKGVSFNKRRKKYAAYIKNNGRQTSLGYFDDQITAAKARDKAAKLLHGNFASLNFPNEH
jgi:hypothetical protein